jgi:hypothetical protein
VTADGSVELNIAPGCLNHRPRSNDNDARKEVILEKSILFEFKLSAQDRMRDFAQAQQRAGGTLSSGWTLLSSLTEVISAEHGISFEDCTTR